MSSSGRGWGEVVSLCLPHLGEATGTQSLKGVWPSQLMGTPVLPFPSQDILASRESSELTKPLQITFIPSLMCLLCPKSEWKAHKRCCPSAELQHKKLILAFPPPREDANDILGNIASAVVDQRCKLLKNGFATYSCRWQPEFNLITLISLTGWDEIVVSNFGAEGDVSKESSDKIEFPYG